MLLGSAPFSILGVALAWWLRREYGDGYEDTAKAILGVALVVCGIAFLVKAYLHSSPEDKPFILTNRDRAIAVATGVVGGFVVGLTSVGSGTIFGLVMLIAFPLTAAKIVGTDIFQAAMLLAVAGAGHLVAGHVDLAATGWLLIGSVPGVLIGGRLTVKLPDRALRIALAATLTLAGVKLVDPPGRTRSSHGRASRRRSRVARGRAHGSSGGGPEPLARGARSATAERYSGSAGGSGQETNGRPVSRYPILYAVQPAQKPVVAASSASAATRRPSAAPTVSSPNA